MKQKVKEKKFSLVVGTTPNRFETSERRLMKPVCHQEHQGGELTGSMLVQDLDRLNILKNQTLTYFVPNNIALLLSVSSRALNDARRLFAENIVASELELDITKVTGDKKAAMETLSSLICDYLEYIQTAIVFGYTAIESFANLSIPNDYVHQRVVKGNDQQECLDKEAIERWLPLKTKLKTILRDVYQTERVEQQKFWEKFSTLEKYRNAIVHQKSISHTEFYKDYFKKNIVGICQSPDALIKFFYNSHAEENRTNPIWPWMDGDTNLPLNTSFSSSNFEVVGNLYEGFRK